MKKTFTIIAKMACVALIGFTVSCNKEETATNGAGNSGTGMSNWDGVPVPAWEAPAKKVKQIDYTYYGLSAVHRFTWNGDNLTHYEAEWNGTFTGIADFTYENGKVSSIRFGQMIDSIEYTSRFVWDGNRVVTETIESGDNRMEIEYTYRNGQVSNIKSDGMTANLTWNDGNLMSVDAGEPQYYTYDNGKNPLHVFTGFFMMHAFDYVNTFSVNTLRSAPSLDVVSYTYDAEGFPVTMSWTMDDGSPRNDTITMTFTYYE